jgi:long-chain acyl-CoA synthetase
MQVESELNTHSFTHHPPFADKPATLTELFRRAAGENNRSDALNFKKNGVWQSISSDQIITRAENIALALYALGIKQGDHAAIISGNCPEWTIVDAGCQFGRVIDVPIYTTLNARQVEYILRDSGSNIVFIQNQNCYEHLKEIAPFLADFKKLVLFDPTGVSGENVISLSAFEKIGQDLKNEQPNLIEKLAAKAKPNDVATLIYTSGTTGEPKGVMLSHENLISNVLGASDMYEFSPNDVSLSVLPLSHVYERTGMYLYIWHGMAVYYAESVEKASDNLREVRPTIFMGVPRIFEKVYAKAKNKAESGGKLKTKIFDWAIEIAKEHARLTTVNKTVRAF